MGNSLFNILYKTTTLSNICGTFVRKSRELYFNKTPTSKSANPDLIVQCIEEKKRHNSVGVKIVQYHKSPLLIETHDRATEVMAKTRKEFHQKNK